MVLYTNLFIAGSQVSDFRNLSFDKALGEDNQTATFSVTLDSPYGRHAGDFTVGNEVVIKADSDTNFEVTRESWQSGSNSFLVSSGTTWQAQTFTVGASGLNQEFTLDNVVLNLYRTGTPGSGIVEIWPTAGGVPSGGSLIGALFNGNAITTNTVGEQVTANFDEFNLERNTQYAIVLKSDGATGSVFHWNMASGAGYSGGTQVQTLNSGADWATAGSTNDFLFQVNTGSPIPATVQFRGILDTINFHGEETNQKMQLRGRDYGARLQDATVEPVVYTNSEVSTIVKDIIANNVEDITTNSVKVTEVTLARITFNHQSVFEALQALSDASGFVFYVDENKDLHFEKRALKDSTVTLDNTNIYSNHFDTTREGFANKIWVYGDRQLVAKEEVLSAGSPLGGSVFTLEQKPHNTQVITSDNPGSVLEGQVFEFAQNLVSGPDYLVNFHDRQIIFVSGNDIGYSTIPSSGGSVIVNYYRDRPIVKYGQNNPSIATFGPKTKVIKDKSIKDPQTAIQVLKDELAEADPLKRLEVSIDGWSQIDVGDTADITLDDFNLSETQVPIINVRYDITKEKQLTENEVIKVKLDNKVTDITDSLLDVQRRLNSLESQDLQEGDFLTRLETTTGSFAIVGSYWEVRTRSIAGLNLIYDSPNFGLLDTYQYAGSGIETSFVLGKNLAAVLGTSKLGQNLSDYTVIASGGYVYS